MAKKKKKSILKPKKEEKKTKKKKSAKSKKEVTKRQPIKLDPKKYPSLDMTQERDIAEDFASKVYEKFDKLIKSIILFGSQTKNTATSTSDIDIIIVVDDAAVDWDQELVAWYRAELGKIISANPYKRELHVNTVKVTTWWKDLLKGDPVVINVLRYGEALFDIGGFFNPIKSLLIAGKIKSTPEAIYTALQRAPVHLARSKSAELGAIEGLYWAMVDSAQAALMANRTIPPSPEHITTMLKKHFVENRMLKMKPVIWFRDIYVLHKGITHGEIKDLKGIEIDDWQDKAEEFVKIMTNLVNKIISEH